MATVPNSNPNVNLELSLFEVNYIIMALQEMPAKYSNPLTGKISTQVKLQLGLFDQVSDEVKRTMNKFKKPPT